MRVAVIGGGWAGLAAAIEATRLGHAVTLYEMAGHLGGRARSLEVDGWRLDNGQHILIGAYRQTLALLRLIGVDEHEALLRTPLRLVYPDGTGLILGRGPAVVAFARAVLSYVRWTWRERLQLLFASARWACSGFCCDASMTVADLAVRLPQVVRRDLIDPLCIAALNTPAEVASGQVFLRVLQDALFSGQGSADLLLPCVGLSALIADPAAKWLLGSGAVVHLSARVKSIARSGDADELTWLVDGQPFDGVVVATTAHEAARLVQPVDPSWAAVASELSYEPIVTVYVHAQSTRLTEPIIALESSNDYPAQFAFDLGRLTGQAGLLGLVISGASKWVSAGLPATAQAALRQIKAQLTLAKPDDAVVVHTIAEKRATFLCLPQMQRPCARVVTGLSVAGDYVEGPYPATLEGSVRAGIEAVRVLWMQ